MAVEVDAAAAALFGPDYELTHETFNNVGGDMTFEYDEEKGWPEDGIAPGTRWADIPEDWSCPDCGAAKADFEMVEVVAS